MTPRTPLAASAALLAALALTACSPADEPAAVPEPAPDTTPTQAPATEPEPTEAPEETPEPVADPTCDTLISEATIASFTEAGWTYTEHPFLAGSEPLSTGFECVWGDYSTANDNVLVFGWAPIDAATASSVQERLLAEGWRRADQDGRLQITEDPTYSFQLDEDGFGTTYEFGEGWVTVASTRQGLLLIELP